MVMYAPFPIEGRRILLLAEGRFNSADAKTAVCLAMYRPRDVVAVLDSTRAGKRVREVLGFGGDAPVVATIDEALDRTPDVAIVGTAPTGGALVEPERSQLARCLRAGIDVVSGMHAFVADDPDLAARAAASGAQIWDVRRVDESRRVSDGRGCTSGARVVLTVGSDGGVGKMTVTIELERAAREAGLRAAWAATGQTGIILRGRGIAIDRVVSDFVGGAAEELVNVEGSGADVVFVEGQGAITHPGFAGVTLGLMYGAMPDALVLVHDMARARYKRLEHPLPPLTDLIDLYEDLMRPWKPARVAAIALNTASLSDSEARGTIADVADFTGLPATDVVRYGCDAILPAIRAAVEV
jgi:D-glutamate N-acetyltransferase